MLCSCNPHPPVQSSHPDTSGDTTRWATGATDHLRCMYLCTQTTSASRGSRAPAGGCRHSSGMSATKPESQTNTSRDHHPFCMGWVRRVASCRPHAGCPPTSPSSCNIAAHPDTSSGMCGTSRCRRHHIPYAQGGDNRQYIRPTPRR